MKKVKVGKSKIHGKGLFTTESIKKGDLILPVHSSLPIDQERIRFIPNQFGKFYNHDEKNFNTSNEIIGDKRYLRAIKNIPAGSELTANYKEHSEMEQPEDFGSGKYASFDFDKTIATPEGLAKAKKMFKDGYNLFIVSAREKVTPDMIARARQAGIPVENIIATGSDEAKVRKVKQLGVEKHFDDKPEVIAALGSVGEQFRKGGGVNSMKYTRSIFGKNKLFVKNKLFKPKKVKNRIYDPNAKYYEDGGETKTKLTKEEEKKFQKFYKTLPENLQTDDSTYDIRGYWDALGRPQEFDYTQPTEADGYYHGFSINPNTGEYLKSPAHPTFQHAVDEDRKIGYRPITNVEGRNIAAYNESIADPEQQTFLRNTEGPVSYKDGGFIVDLSEEDIQRYIDGGYIVEEMDDPSIPALNQFDNGGSPKSQWIAPAERYSGRSNVDPTTGLIYKDLGDLDVKAGKKGFKRKVQDFFRKDIGKLTKEAEELGKGVGYIAGVQGDIEPAVYNREGIKKFKSEVKRLKGDFNTELKDAEKKRKQESDNKSEYDKWKKKLDDGDISASEFLLKGKGKNWEAYNDVKVAKGTGSDADYSATAAGKEWGDSDQWKKFTGLVSNAATAIPLLGAAGAMGSASAAILENPYVQAGLTAYGVNEAVTNTLPEAYKDFSEGRYWEGLGNTALGALDFVPGAALASKGAKLIPKAVNYAGDLAGNIGKGFKTLSKAESQGSILSKYRNIEELRHAKGYKDFKSANEAYPELFPTQESFMQAKNEANALLKEYTPKFEKQFGKGKDDEILVFGAHDDVGKLNSKEGFLVDDEFAKSTGLENDLTNQQKFLGDTYQLEYSGYFNQNPGYGGNKEFAKYLSNQIEPVIGANKLKAPAQVRRTSSFNRPVKTMRGDQELTLNYDDLLEGDVIYPEHNWSTTTDMTGNVWGSGDPTSKVAVINVPEGQSAFRPNMYTGSQYVAEQELLLPSKLGYKVSGVNTKGFGSDSPRFIFDVHNPYKYGGALSKFIGGGSPCDDGYTYDPKLGCIPMSEESMTEAQQWMTNWYKNRTIEFPEDQKGFKKANEKVLPAYNPESPMFKQMESFPVYEPIPEEYMEKDPGGYAPAGMYDGEGKVPTIYFSPDLNDEQKTDTEIHELTNHFMRRSKDLYPMYDKIVKENIIPFDKTWPKEKQEFYDYIINPEEQNIQSYLNVARKKFNLKPDEVVTPERLNKMREEAKKKGLLEEGGKNFNPDIFLLFRTAKDDESLMRLFNLIAKKDSNKDDIQYGQYGGSLHKFIEGGNKKGCPSGQYWNGTKCTKLITLKDDRKYIDGVANWAMHVSDPNMVSGNYNDQIKDRLYSGKWGFDPESGALVRLDKIQPQSVTTLDAKTKASREKEKLTEQNYKAEEENKKAYDKSITDAGFDPATFGKAKGVNTITGEPIYASSKEEADRINQEAINQFAIQGHAAVVNNPVFKAAASFTPVGMAIGAMEGLARFIPDATTLAQDPTLANAGQLGLDALQALPVVGKPLASATGKAFNYVKNLEPSPPGPLMLLGRTNSGGNMVKKNMNYYKQLLDSYDGKKMSFANRKFYNDLIETGKKQDGMVTEAQLNELNKLQNSNFDFGKRGYNKESLLQVEPKAPIEGGTPPPVKSGYSINLKGAFQRYPKGPLTEEEILNYKNSPQYQSFAQQHADLINKHGSNWNLPNYMDEHLNEAVSTGNRSRVNPVLYGGRNWNATDYTIAGLVGSAYPGAAAVVGTAFSPPPVKSKILRNAGITGVPGGLSSKDTLIDITNAPMDFAKVNETKDGKIIIGGEFIENANNSVRTAKDWLTANDTYSDKNYPSNKIESFYGIEDGKFKVGKANEFDPDTEIVPRRFGAKNIDKAIMNGDEMRLLDKNGDPIYQNTPNTGKFILYSPSTKKAEFAYMTSGKKGVNLVNDFLKKNKDAQYIHLDNGRYEYYGLNPGGLTKQDFESYYHQDLGREGTPGYNLIIKEDGGEVNHQLGDTIDDEDYKKYLEGLGYTFEEI